MVLPERYLLYYTIYYTIYQKGTSYLFPDSFDKLVEPIPLEERGDVIAAYHRRLHGDNKEVLHLNNIITL